jgi:hypothetical protein
MTPVTIREERLGKVTLRLLKTKDGYAAIAFEGETRTGPIFGDDADELWAQVRREVAKVSPNYFGFDGAKARFLRMFPDGFADRRFVSAERDYKVAASEALGAELSLEQACNADPDLCSVAIRAFARTNLLSTFEQVRIREVLKSAEGPAFLRGAAQFADGDVAQGLAVMTAALKRHGPASWPLVTYLPFLWRPDRHLFLKPQVTRDFAERVGHPFAEAYDANLTPKVYAALMALAAATEAELADLAPRDRIDLQSFIWVVGAYHDMDAEAEAPLMASEA